MSFPPANEIFQFAGFASCRYGFTTRYPLGGGLPHSEISGSPGARPSPELFAACHVLHRLSVPRHPPDALLVLAHAQPQDRAIRAPRNPCVSIAPTRACAPAYLAYPCPGTTDRPTQSPGEPESSREPEGRSSCHARFNFTVTTRFTMSKTSTADVPVAGRRRADLCSPSGPAACELGGL